MPYLRMMRGERGGRVGVVQREVVVRKQVLHALQVREPRGPSARAASPHQPLVLR